MKQYVFPETREVRDESRMPAQIGSTFICKRPEWLRAGWREIRSWREIPVGYRLPADAWRTVNDDGECVDMTFIEASLVDIAAEDAAAAASAAAAAIAAKEQAALDAGDVLLAKVLVVVINKRLAADKQITKAECVEAARKILGLA